MRSQEAHTRFRCYQGGRELKDELKRQDLFKLHSRTRWTLYFKPHTLYLTLRGAQGLPRSASPKSIKDIQAIEDLLTSQVCVDTLCEDTLCMRVSVKRAVAVVL